MGEVFAAVDRQVRARGTIGGNACFADPASNYPPLLVALGATMEVAGPDGRRTVAAEDFFVGIYRTALAGGNVHAVFSKFEPIYARRAFPCFDEPSFKVPFDVTLTVPKDAVALGNMPVAATSEVADKQVVTFATTPPLPSYLLAFAVGPLASKTATVAPSSVRASALPLSAVALRGREADAAFAIAESPALIAEEERYFGMPFPYPKLDLLGIPDFQSGAMENAGLIVFRDASLLVNADASTLDQRIQVLDTIAHEVAHQWFGDQVTMRWWDDLWLNESFASFLATRTLRTVKPEFEHELIEVKSVNDVMNSDGLASTRRIRQPITGVDDITNAFDAITYLKGEAVLAMVESFVGDDVFQRGLHDYLAIHAGGNASTVDLVGALSKASGRDLTPLFSSFLDQPGSPLIAAHATCTGGQGAIALEQSRWLHRGARFLTTAERMALGGDLDAAFRSGALSSTDALHAIEPLARDAHGAVAWIPLVFYKFMSENVLDGAAGARIDTRGTCHSWWNSVTPAGRRR